NLAAIQAGDEWLVAEDFFSGGEARIRLEPLKAPGAQADLYYAQYGKAKKGLAALRAEISAGERELEDVEKRLALLVGEENPLVLAKILRGEGAARKPARSPQAKAKKRPGLAFKSGDWLMLVGRDADENDALLRRHVRGSDLWLHARDFPGAYVFIKARAGKSFPLEALLDAGNLALFYSKGRSGGEGDLFYTQAKYLRRAKNGPKGLVIPTQEKNLRIKLDDARLRRLETCRVD
ncbi:MAG: NFACT RNA binding domain-containing protein, partial [Treponema sp.]|nr:NFACT RNA binding domain-containing protein [Treponema sp.]